MTGFPAAPTADDVLAAWNAPANAAVRRATRPPRGPGGPFRVIDAGQGATASPQGAYEVLVFVGHRRGPIGGRTVVPCGVVFWYGSGYAGGPATVMVHADPADGTFDIGRAVMYFGVNTDFGNAPRAIQHPDGRLSRKDGG